MSRNGIYIGGSAKGGKSTFISTCHRLLPHAELETFDTCWPFDTDSLTIFTNPPTLQFDGLADWYEQHHFIGYIALLDSRQFDASFADLVQSLWYYAPFPYILAANFQDQPEAWSLPDLRIAYHLPDEIPLLPCVASDIQSVRNILLAFLEYATVWDG